MDPVRPLRNGEYRLRLGKPERAVLRSLCHELRELIQEQDEGVARLYPAAYRDDPAASAEFARLVHGELTAGRLEAILTVESTLDAETLDHAQLSAWCGALNDLRLVLGERLGVTEDMYEQGIDPRDPRGPDLALYGWLTWLQGSVVEALASRL